MKLTKIRWGPLFFGVFAIAAGLLSGIYGHELIAENGDAREVIVTTFSILAGFLIAVMTLLGDQSMLPGTWRIAEASRQSIKAKLIRQKWLFYTYLITLILIFVSTLTATRWPEETEWLERTYFAFATGAFLISFRLPTVLMEVQMERVDAVVAARRQTASKLERS